MIALFVDGERIRHNGLWQLCHSLWFDRKSLAAIGSEVVISIFRADFQLASHGGAALLQLF